MLIKDLYNIEDAYQCKNNNRALELFNKLRDKIGNTHTVYRNTRLLSGRQFATSHNAISYIKNKDYTNAIREVYDFLDNYGDNEHELTDAEYAVLTCILDIV